MLPGAFGLFFTQSPFPAYQRTMKLSKGTALREVSLAFSKPKAIIWNMTMALGKSTCRQLY
jgi:hypothetical protein